MKVLFILIFSVFIGIIIKTVQPEGSQSAMVIPHAQMADNWNGFELKDTRVEKCVILGDTVIFDAASSIRCDDLYKYYHIIGYGKILGCSDMVYLYRLNLPDRFITIPELITMHNNLIKNKNHGKD